MSLPDIPTLGELIRDCAARLEKGGIFCGHGTDNCVDEAAVLVGFATGIEHGELAGAIDRPADAQQVERALALCERRIRERLPAPYLTGEAWFAGLRFFVDQRVLIPRSPFAELIGERFTPWIRAAAVRRILDVGTGSGCIAIACARAFPGASVTAADIDAGALEVARVNIRRHGLAGRVELYQANLFEGLTGRYDLIVSNPPYVPAGRAASLPPEYRHEPAAGLYAGADGLETVRRILQDARGHLVPGGWLALEVGEVRAPLESAFPDLPFIWPELEHGGEGIALVGAADLDRLK